MKSVEDKSDKKQLRAKKIFLKELKESIAEAQQASRGKIKLRPLDEVIAEIESKHGGKRNGAGRKPKTVKKVTHGVKLTAEEHKAIVKKYGSFAKGVRSLIPEQLLHTNGAQKVA